MDPKRATVFLAVLVLVLALLSWLPRGTPPPQSAEARDFDYLIANGVPRKVARAPVMDPKIMDAVKAEIAERRRKVDVH
jgi:hypothetical protein